MWFKWLQIPSPNLIKVLLSNTSPHFTLPWGQRKLLNAILIELNEGRKKALKGTTQKFSTASSSLSICNSRLFSKIYKKKWNDEKVRIINWIEWTLVDWIEQKKELSGVDTLPS